MNLAVVDVSLRRAKIHTIDVSSPLDELDALLTFTQELTRGKAEEYPLFALFTGPLTGTGAPGSGGYGFLWRDQAGFSGTFCEGRIGAMLRHAGISHLVVHGRAKKPLYLDIDDTGVTVRDSDKLAALPLVEQTAHIARGNDSDDVAVLVRTTLENDDATLMEDCVFPQSAPGLTTLWDDMNVTALSASGSGGITLAKPDKFLAECMALYQHKAIVDPAAPFRQYGTPVMGRYLSPWPGKPSDQAEEAMLLPARVLGLAWNKTMPFSGPMAHAVKLLTHATGTKFSAKSVTEHATKLIEKMG